MRECVSFRINCPYSSPKYSFFDGLGYTRNTGYANIFSTKVLSLSISYAGDDSSDPFRVQGRRSLFGSTCIRSSTIANTHNSAQVENPEASTPAQLQRLKREHGRARKHVFNRVAAIISAHPDLVSTIKHRVTGIDSEDRARLRTYYRWVGLFISDKWTRVLMVNNGAGNNLTIDNEEEEEESDQGQIVIRSNRNRRAAPGTDETRMHMFNTTRFQHLNKLETLASNLKRSEMAQYAHLILGLYKCQLDMDYLSISDCWTLYNRLVKCSVQILEVQRRMGKTVSHMTNSCKEIAFFPMSAHCNIYVTHDGNLTTNAFDVAISNIPDMVAEFNKGEKIEFLRKQQLVRETALAGGRDDHSNGKKTNDTTQLQYGNVYLQGIIQTDKNHKKITVNFIRIDGTGTQLDSDKRPFVSNTFKCRVIREGRVSVFVHVFLWRLLNPY